MTTVTTVLGDVPSDELGIVYPHEHLLFDVFRGFQPHREFLVNDPDLVIAELGEFVAAGGTTLVEVSTPDLGRDPKGLQAIARAAGVHVVMSTGRYREPFYEPELWRRSTTNLADEFVADIEVGVDGVRAGIIGEIGTHEPHVSPAEERVHRAAARAHLRTGTPITTHANASPVGLDQLDLFAEEGVDLRHVVVGHCDTHPFLDYHRAILARGAYVQYDTVRGNYEYETLRHIDHVVTLVGEGFGEQLLLSQDMASNRFYTVYGGRGFGFLAGEFRERLAAAGLGADDIDQIMIHNSRRMLQGAQ